MSYITNHFVVIGILLIILFAISFIIKRRSYITVTMAFVSVGMLVLAVSEPYLKLNRSDSNNAVLLFDISSSIDKDEFISFVNEAHKKFDSASVYDNLNYVVFADKAIDISMYYDNLHDVEFAFMANDVNLRQARNSVNDTSDIMSAIMYSISLLRGAGDIILYTDGLETANTTFSQDMIDYFPDIKLIVNVPDFNDSRDFISLNNVNYSSLPAVGQDLVTTVEIASSINETVSLDVVDLVNDYSSKFELDVVKGVNYFEIPVKINADHNYYEYHLDAESIEVPKKIYYQAVEAVNRPKTAIITNEDAVFNNVSHMISQYSDVYKADLYADFSEFDLLVLQDWMFSYISDSQLKHIQKCVENGMGIFILASPNTFGPEIIKTEIKDLLPVEIYHSNMQSLPSIAVVFVIDTSGSMKETKILIAKNIINKTVDRLSLHDKVGIVEFYDNRRWAAPIQSASNKFELNRAISRLTPSGATEINPALIEAYYGLMNVHASSKHVVVLSDGGFKRDKILPFIENMVGSAVSVSAICIGDMPNTPFMYKMSESGKGVFFFARDRFSIPELNFKSSYSNLGDISIDNNNLGVNLPHSVFRKINIESLSLLSNYYFSNLKPDTILLLSDKDNNPVVSYKQYGLGVSAFCSGDLFYHDNIDSAVLFQNLCRFLFKKVNDKSIVVSQCSNSLDVSFNLPSGFNSIIKPQAMLASGDKSISFKDLIFTSKPGVLDAQFTDLSSGFYDVAVVDNKGKEYGRTVCGFNQITEENQMMHNRELINTFPTPNRTINNNYEIIELWPLFIVLSLITFLINIVYRRMKLVFILPFVILLCGVNIIEASDCGNIAIYKDGVRQSEAIDVFDMLVGNVSKPYDNTNSKIDYRDDLLKAISFYRKGNYDHSFQILDSLLDKSYGYNADHMIFAWTMIVSDKIGTKDIVLDKIYNSQDLTIRYFDVFSTALAMERDIDRLLAIKDIYSSSSIVDDTEIEYVNSQILAILPYTDEQGVTVSPSNNAEISLINLFYNCRRLLLSGRKDEAESFLLSFIDRGLTEQVLMKIVLFAFNHDLFEACDKTAETIMSSKGRHYFDAGIVRIKSAIKSNNKSLFIKTINEMESSELLPLSQLSQLSKFYLQIGDNDSAIRLLKHIYYHSNDIDDLIAIADYYENISELDIAFKFWLEIWQKYPVQLNDYEIKLLDIARLSGNLPSLAVKLESDLDKSKDLNSLYLLLSLYIAVGDNISVSNLVEQYYGIDTIESLNIQQHCFLLCKDYESCEDVLIKLNERDKRNSEIYLRKLAILASLRKDEDKIDDLIDLLTLNHISQSLDMKKMAITLQYLGKYDEALSINQKLLKADPYDGEVLLNWVNNCISAGEQEAAIKRIASLLNSEMQVEILPYVVDSLFNLDADKEYFELALSVVCQQLQDNSHMNMLYELAIDIAEEIGHYSCAINLILAELIENPDRNFQLMRHARRIPCINSELCNDFAFYLLYSNCKMSNDDYVQICKDMIDADLHHISDYIVSCHLNPSKDVEMVLDIADYYMLNGMVGKSCDIINNAILYNNTDYELSLKLGFSYITNAENAKAYQLLIQLYDKLSNSISNDSNHISIKQRVLNGLILCANDIENDLISILADRASNSEVKPKELIRQYIDDIIYVCERTSNVKALKMVLDMYDQGPNEDFVSIIKKSLDSIQQNNQSNRNRYTKGEDFNSFASKQDINNYLSTSFFADNLVLYAGKFLDVLNNNKYIDDNILKQFYYTVWSRLTEKEKLSYASLFTGLSNYSSNVYINLMKIETGVLSSFPLEYFKINSDIDILCAIFPVADAEMQKNIVSIIMSGDTKELTKNISTYLSCVEEKYIAEHIDQIIDELKQISFKVKEKRVGYADFNQYFSYCYKYKEVLSSLIDKLINDNPDIVIFKALRVKYFPEMYAGKKYISEIKSIIGQIITQDVYNVNVDIIISEMLSRLTYEQLNRLNNDMNNAIGNDSFLSKYIIYAINLNLSKYDYSFRSLHDAYFANNDNKRIRGEYIQLLEQAGANVDLAKTLQDMFIKQGLSVDIAWRDVAKAYIQAGDYKSAFSSIKHLHETLCQIDLLYLEYLFDKSDVLALRFRDIYGDYSFSRLLLPCPEWSVSYGIEQWDNTNQYLLPFENRYVYCISDNIKLHDEMINYWNVLASNQNGLMNYAMALGNNIVHSGMSDSILKELSDKYDVKELTKKDSLLLFAIYYHLPVIPNEYEKLFDYAIDIVSSYKDYNAILSKSYLIKSDYKNAIKYAQKEVANEFWDNSLTYFSNKIYMKYNYLVSLHDYCFDGIAATIALVDSKLKVLPDNDDLISLRIKLYSMVDGTIASMTVDKYLSDRKYLESISFVRESLKLAVRNNMEDIFKTLIDRYYLDNLTFRACIDYNYIFNDCDDDILIEYADIIFGAIKESKAEKGVVSEVLLKDLCLLAKAVYAEYPGQSSKYLEFCHDHFNLDTANALWLSDAYSVCGQIDKAEEIEKHLAEINRLPYSRLTKQKAFN